MLSTDHLIVRFSEQFGDAAGAELFFSPGRVNIIGEHLDYNGGLVFPAAISLGIYAVVRKNGTNIVNIRSAGFSGAVAIPLDGDIARDADTSWGDYPRGVIRYLLDGGYPVHGADILLESTLPGGSGLSSSACVEVLTACIMLDPPEDASGLRADIALLCRRVENEFIGVNCGIMDQFSIAMGRAECAILLDAGTLRYEHVPLRLGNSILVIMNTMKPRKLSDSKYNERRAECERALEQVRRRRDVKHLADARLEDLEHIDDDTLKRRARHVITEQARVLESVDVLKRGDLGAFGKLMDRSHESLRRDYEVTGPELDALVDAARASGWCLGARMTGAGFGGCAIALVHGDRAAAFRDFVARAYSAKTGLSAEFYECRIHEGAGKITRGGR